MFSFVYRQMPTEVTGKERENIIRTITLEPLDKIKLSEDFIRDQKLEESMRENGFRVPVIYDPRINFVPDGNTRVGHLKQIEPKVEFLPVIITDYYRSVELTEWEREIPGERNISEFARKWDLVKTEEKDEFLTKIWYNERKFTFRTLQGEEKVEEQLQKIWDIERYLMGSESNRIIYRGKEQIDVRQHDTLFIFLPKIKKELALKRRLPPKTTRHIYDKVIFVGKGIPLDKLRGKKEDACLFLKEYLNERYLFCVEKNTEFEGRVESGRLFFFTESNNFTL